MTLKRSFGLSVLTPNNSAARAFSIFPSSAIEPEVSMTKTMSFAVYSLSAQLSFGEIIKRK